MYDRSQGVVKFIFCQDLFKRDPLETNTTHRFGCTPVNEMHENYLSISKIIPQVFSFGR